MQMEWISLSVLSMNIIAELVFVSSQEQSNETISHSQMIRLVVGQVLVVLVADKLAFTQQLSFINIVQVYSNVCAFC